MRGCLRRCLFLVLIAAGGCSLARSPGIPERAARRFYLTKEAVQGNRALAACTRGFHMASRFELVDPSALAYDTKLGITTDDSGAGPPSAAAVYDASPPSGWVRTGGGSQYTDAPGTPASAATNCAAWSTASHDAFGTVAFLTDRFAGTLWDGGARRCDEPFHVWCIGSRAGPANEGGEEWSGRHGRRGRGR